MIFKLKNRLTPDETFPIPSVTDVQYLPHNVFPNRRDTLFGMLSMTTVETTTPTGSIV